MKNEDQEIIQACQRLLKENKTPAYIYSEKTLRQQVKIALEMPFVHSHLVRFAIKANSNKNIIKLFDSMGLHFDASSEFEVQRMLEIGISGEKILLTSQQCAKNPEELLQRKVLLNACSLHQLKTYAPLAGKYQSPLTIRFNPGDEYKIDFKRNVSGIQSSFGVWHEQLDEAFAIVKKYGAKVKTLHSHIGSGTNDDIWVEAAQKSLEVLKKWEDISTINLGGGFWVNRAHNEMADLKAIAHKINQSLKDFSHQTNRKVNIEIEPGTFLVAKAGYLLMSIDDLCTTGKNGYHFVKLNGGMNDYIRSSLYKDSHRITHLKNPSNETKNPNDSLVKNKDSYVLVGHCCENGDILSAGGKEENFALVELDHPQIGDGIIIHDTGAYGSSMASHYNSYPFSAEYWLNTQNNLQIARRKQNLTEIYAQEIEIKN